MSSCKLLHGEHGEHKLLNFLIIGKLIIKSLRHKSLVKLLISSYVYAHEKYKIIFLVIQWSLWNVWCRIN